MPTLTSPPVSWPLDLQKCIDSNTFTLTEDPQYISTAMTYGPMKSRRVVTRGFQKLTVSIAVNKSQYNSFISWWNNQLMGGAGAFFFKHPINQDTQKTYKNEKPYSMSTIGPNNWRIAMSWVQVGDGPEVTP